MTINYNRYKFLKNFKKELTLVLPAQEIKAAPPLSQVLTQAGLNTAEVCEKFNALSKIFPSGSFISTSIFFTPKEKNFEICFRPFQLKYILQQYIQLKGVEFSENSQPFYQISIIDLYKTLQIKSFILNQKNQRKLFNSILGTLRSYDLPVHISFSMQDFEHFIKNNIISDKNLSQFSDHLEYETKLEINKDENLEKSVNTNEIDIERKEVDDFTYIQENFIKKTEIVTLNKEASNLINFFEEYKNNL